MTNSLQALGQSVEPYHRRLASPLLSGRGTNRDIARIAESRLMEIPEIRKAIAPALKELPKIKAAGEEVLEPSAVKRSQSISAAASNLWKSSAATGFPHQSGETEAAPLAVAYLKSGKLDSRKALPQLLPLFEIAFRWNAPILIRKLNALCIENKREFDRGSLKSLQKQAEKLHNLPVQLALAEPNDQSIRYHEYRNKLSFTLSSVEDVQKLEKGVAAPPGIDPPLIGIRLKMPKKARAINELIPAINETLPKIRYPTTIELTRFPTTLTDEFVEKSINSILRGANSSKHLVEMDCSALKLQDHQLQTLLQIKTLSILRLDDIPLQASTLAEALNKLSNLKLLSLKGCRLGDEGLKILSPALESHPALKDLTLAENGLTERSDPTLASILNKAARLKRLDLSGNPLTDIPALCTAVEKSASLQALNLSRTELGKESLARVIEAVEKGKSVAQFTISENALDDSHAEQLASGILKGYVCKSLELSGSTASITTIKPIATALESNPVLSTLGLDKLRLDDREALALAEALEHNDTLGVLGLSENAIGAEGAAALQKLLERNTRLSGIHLFGNPLPSEVKTELKKNSRFMI